ncbi:MAG: phosphatidate cytidylyltransferase [Burkholderiaceae bacterium]|nr:phosphatidate cytidylyltransferase [Burkholderiaceae bacterium]
MLRTRVITAVVLLLILLPSIFVAPPPVWGAVSLVFLAAAAFEWTRLLPGEASAWRVAGLMTLIGSTWLAFSVEQGIPASVRLTLYAASTLFWLLVAPARLSRVAAHGRWPGAVVLLMACWSALYDLRELGALVLFCAMAIVWIADIGAYFAGKSFGRHKLAPRISPGKSWEGAIGGALAVVIVAMATTGVASMAQVLPAMLSARIGWLATVIVLCLLAALSVLGDLHESLLKRLAGVKDSGATLPGHGGVLDRIDALIPVMPVVAMIHLVLQD